jgi:chemotaxis-related protein WspB
MLLLRFTIGESRYAIDVGAVVEVIPRVELRPVPHAPRTLAGLLSYHGHAVPIIDLGVLIDDTPCRQCLSTRIILVDESVVQDGRTTRRVAGEIPDKPASEDGKSADSSLLGLIAEHVNDLTHVSVEQIAQAPVMLPDAPYLERIVEIDRELVQLIGVDKIRAASLPSVRLQLPAASDAVPSTLQN